MAQITCPKCGSPEKLEIDRTNYDIYDRICYKCVDCGEYYHYWDKGKEQICLLSDWHLDLY